MLPALPQPVAVPPGVPQATINQIAQEIQFIQNFALNTFGQNIAAIPYLIVPGLSHFNGQAGLFLNPRNAFETNFWAGQINPHVPGYAYPGGPIMLIAANFSQNPAPNNLSWGIIFHEMGHAALGRTEPPAFACEILAIENYVNNNPHNIPNIQQVASTYLQQRRALGMYSQLAPAHDVAARAAYQNITGVPL